MREKEEILKDSIEYEEYSENVALDYKINNKGEVERVEKLKKCCKTNEKSCKRKCCGSSNKCCRKFINIEKNSLL